MPAGPSDRPVSSPSGQTSRAFCVRPTLGPKQRLRHDAQFRQAYAQDHRWHGRLMVLFRRAAPDASLRLGVVASKKVGNAIDRARAKRRLREVFRLHRAALTGSTDDLVLVARRPLLRAPWSAVTAEFLRLCRDAGLTPPSAP